MVFKHYKYICLCVVVLSAGCSLAPKYETPPMAVKAEFPQTRPYKYDAEEINYSELILENFIKDDRLYAVILRALHANRGLRATIADTQAAMATYRVKRADLLPSVYAGGSAGRSQAVTGSASDRYSAELGLSAFEIDLFGKNRNLRDAALQQYLAMEKTAQAAVTSLVAETAIAWLTLHADMQLLRLAHKTVQSARKSADIAKRRQESGLTSVLDVHQADTIYQQARVDIANYSAVVAQGLNALELLTGGPLPQELLPNGEDNTETAIGYIGVGLDSKILLRRPDIAAAEHTLRAANANIGAARAAFFPSVSLLGSGGFASGELSDLFKGSSKIWSYSGNINIPIFKGGANKANLDYANAKYRSYLAQYDKAIQTAFKEVADVLARKSTIFIQISAQDALVNSSGKSYDLAEKRYSAGVDSYLNVLQSQRTFYAAEKALISVKLLELTNRINLFRVLGGDEAASIYVAG